MVLQIMAGRVLAARSGGQRDSTRPSQALCPCIPVLPAPGLIGLRQPRRWSSHQGPSGTSLFATELAVAESMPCLMNALCNLSRPLQIFSPPMQCSWTHQRETEGIFVFSFPCFIKMVPVCWDKSQPHTAGRLAALCGGVVPS